MTIFENPSINEENFTMNLPIIQHHDKLIQAVEAKDLYQKLGLHSAHWAKWCSRNINQNEFAIEGQDYQGFTQWVNGNMTKNYLLSISFAKKLSMQVKTQAGENIRNYFLACEEKAVQAYQPKELTRMDLIRLAYEAEQERLALEYKVNELQPKADALDVISVASNSLCVRETAKTLGIQQNKFIAWCINHDWLYRDSKAKLCPISHRVQNGFLEQRAVPYNKPNGEVGVSTQAMFTGKALTHLAKTFAIIKEVA